MTKNDYKIETKIDEDDSFFPCKVDVYWKGELMQSEDFNTIEQAGEYVQKVEAFLKHRKY